MTRQLGTRLLRGTCLLLVAMLAATWLAGLYAARAFASEFTQTLNRSIGMYVAAEQPLGPEGAPDRARLAQLAAQAMVLNPAAELYLLDVAGRVVWPTGPERLAEPRVPLEPLQRFFAADAPRRAILGADPRRPGAQVIFSAAALQHAGRPAGYVYVVIGGSAYRGLVATVAQSHILRVSTISVGVLLLLATLAAWGLHRSISRPLRALHAGAMAHAYRLGIAEVGGAPADHGAREREAEAANDIEAVGRVIDGLVERIGQQLQALEKVDRSRRELLAHVSHDLRTPLTAIRGYVETLLAEDCRLPAERRHTYLATIARHGDRLQRLVEQVFLLSRLDAELLPLQREPVFLAELVADIAGKWQLAADAAGLRLLVRVDRATRAVSADIALVEAVIENLLDNALRHRCRSSAVEVEVVGAASGVAVRVRNVGGGADAAHAGAAHAGAADPAATGVEARRSGLGLAIVRRVVALHGGSFEIGTSPDESTLAQFVLP